MALYTHTYTQNTERYYAIIHRSGIITVMIGTFTLSHIWLVLLNRTTIENTQFQSWNKARKLGNAKDRLIEVFTETGKNVFNQGCRDNWIEVMGDNKLLWFCKYIYIYACYCSCYSPSAICL